MLAAQKSVRDNMRTYLETMNVPTREDIARLGELVVGLEEKSDQIADRIDDSTTSCARRSGSFRQRPAGRRGLDQGAAGSIGSPSDSTRSRLADR